MPCVVLFRGQVRRERWRVEHEQVDLVADLWGEIEEVRHGEWCAWMNVLVRKMSVTREAVDWSR